MAQLLKRTKKSCIKFFRKLTSSAKSSVNRLDEETNGSCPVQKCFDHAAQQKIQMRCPYSISSKISNNQNETSLNSNNNRNDNSTNSETTESTHFMVPSQYISKFDTYLNTARHTINPSYLSCNVRGMRNFRLLTEEETPIEFATRRCSAGIIFEKVKYRDNVRYFRRTPSNTSLSSHPSTPKAVGNAYDYSNPLNEKKKDPYKSTYTQKCQNNIFLQFRNNISHPVNLTLSSNPAGNLNNLVISEGRNWLNEPCPIVSWDINGNSIDDDILCLNSNWDDCDNRLNMLKDKRLAKTLSDGSYKSSSKSSSTTLETWLDDEVLDNSFNEEIEKQFRI